MTHNPPPLSFAQEQLWFIDEFHHGLPAHNVPCVVWLDGDLDVPALTRALGALIARHEPLRTRLAPGDGGRPVQLIDPSGADSSLEYSSVPADEAARRVRALAEDEALRPFHLADDHPLRGRLVRIAADSHALVLVAHQTAIDDRSLRVLVADLAALYHGFVTGQAAELTPLPGRFAEHAERERDRIQGRVLAELDDYWRTTLAGVETSRFPADRPRPVLADHTGAVEQLITDVELLGRLRELSSDTGITLLAALLVLLHRYTGQADMITGMADDARTGPELTGLVAFLENMLPVRVDASRDPAFSEFLTRVRDAVDGARAHDLPFARVVDALDIDRDPGRFPVFQTAFRYVEPVPPISAQNLTFRYERVRLRASRYDVSVVAEPTGDGLRLEATYTPALYDTATIRRLLASYEVLLRDVVSHPEEKLSGLAILTDAELNAELVEWNSTDTDLPVQCVHEGFQERVAAAPSAVAAEFAGAQISYAELNRQANQIARLLRSHGVGPEVLVGVCMGTGLRRLAALLGVWKAGGGYVPLDPGLPAERLSFMIADTGMRVVLTDGASMDRVPSGNVVDLDAAWDQVRSLDDSDWHDCDWHDTGVTPANVAYVIYTSGSTGQPKGVVVEHGQVIHFLHGMARHWRIGPGSAVLQFAAFTFDVSVMDMFMPLLGGAKVVLAAPETLHSPPRLAELIRDAHITFACLPPTVLNLLTGEDFPELRTLLSSGEELSSELLKAWLHIGAEIYNGYGPTECSIGSVFMKLEPSTPLPPPIGRPKPNYRAYVLDAHLNPVPVGVTGELHIGGPGVARGYLNRPDLTRERFIPDPFRPGGRLYKTGDLVRRRPDGTLVFAGRMDNQVKIRGLRIEPGEIETALASHADVAQAVVTVVTDPAGVQQLAGYLRPADGTSIDVGGIRRYLAQSLPSYMVPTYLIALAELPLTAHGKVDKAALPLPPPGSAGSGAAGSGAAGSGSGDVAPPRTAIEAVLTDLYATVLGVECVGVTDSFFEAGGNSLQAMRLITELRTALAVDLDITAVFLTPAPCQLAEVLRDQHGFADSDLGPDGVEGLDQYLQDNPV
jgi:amino acid adenylation domain-containing protein